MRVVGFIAVVASLVLVVPAAAQDGDMPTELWAEYPLVQKVERSSQPSLAPLLPPVDTETAVAPDDGVPWGLWALAAATGVLALLVATRLARPTTGSRVRQRDAPAQLRPASYPRPSSSLPVAQYAPSPSLVLADAPDEPRRSVVRRSGLLRSRYVVLESQSSGEQEAVLASRSFWNVGGATTREHFAEDAWDDLVNELRASGWEPDPTRRSDFYVLLQQVEPEPSSIVPTLEAYGRAGDNSDDA